MTPESNQVRWFFYRSAALLVPIVAVPTLTFTLLNWGHTATLDDPNPAVRVAAVRDTGWRGHIDLLTRALQDEDTDVRLVAAMYLKMRREKAEPSAKALISLLKDEHEGVRCQAAEALHAIGAAAAPVLVSALTNPDPRVRAKAAWALQMVAFEDNSRYVSPDELASIASALEKMLQDEVPEVRRNAAKTLGLVRRAQAGEKLVTK